MIIRLSLVLVVFVVCHTLVVAHSFPFSTNATNHLHLYSVVTRKGILNHSLFHYPPPKTALNYVMYSCSERTPSYVSKTEEFGKVLKPLSLVRRSNVNNIVNILSNILDSPKPSFITKQRRGWIKRRGNR